MKRSLALVAIAGFAVAASAQRNPESMSWSDRFIAASISIAKATWQKLQKEGRPLAERLLKAAPDYYKGTQKTLQDFMKKVQTSDLPQTFSEKQRVALELWKLRGAINVMSLSNPETLKMLLNIQPSTVEKMQKDLQQTETKLKKANLPGI